MSELDARRVLLLSAWEDPPTPPWTAEDAARLTLRTLQAVGSSAPPERALAHRAELGIAELGARAPALKPVLARALTWGTWPRGLTPAVLLGAAAVGLLADALGPSQRLNLLSPPLLGLLAWNLVVYAVMLSALVWRPAPRPSIELPSPLKAVLRWTLRRGQRAASALPPTAPGLDAAMLAATLGRHAAAIRRLVAPEWSARLQALLHGGAALMAAGLLASMYARGLAVEYRAAWESTFLDAGQVTGLLRLLYGPAAALLGWPAPDLATVETLHAGAASGAAGLAPYAGGSAAPWLHLQALTVAALVVLPRAVLALLAATRARRVSGWDLQTLASPVLDRLARDLRGEALQVVAAAYGHTPSAAAIDAVQRWCRRELGVATSLRWLPPLPTGAEDDADALAAAQQGAAAAQRWLLLFNATATPERETHGRCLDLLRAGTAVPLQLLLDLGTLRQRLGPGATARLDQRRAAWTTLALEAQLPLAIVDADATATMTDPAPAAR